MIKSEAINDYIARYRHKAALLAVIHSQLANKNSGWDLGHTFAIVVLTGLITFLGFIGTDRIIEALSAVESVTHVDLATKAPASASETVTASLVTSGNVPSTQATKQSVVTPLARKATFDFWFNLGVLLLFVASLLNLIFRWKERYVAHFSGVVKLRQFIGWLDELALFESSSIDAGKLKYIRHKYESIVELLPPNSDRDYIRAKSGMKESIQSHNSFDDEQLVIKIVRHSPITMEVLKIIIGHSTTLWLGGGSIRTLVWNYLTGRSEDVHDYDIVYFNQRDLDEATDKRIEAELKAKLPRSIKISVKNQARMHEVNGEPKRSSIEDAIANWPEKATATAIRLDDSDGSMHFIAPYGFDDVLNLVVQPTPYHENNSAAFRRRLAEKDWKAHWPELEVRNTN